MAWTDRQLARYVRPHEMGTFFQMCGLKDIGEVKDRQVADWLGLDPESLTFADAMEGEGDIDVGLFDDGGVSWQSILTRPIWADRY